MHPLTIEKRIKFPVYRSWIGSQPCFACEEMAHANKGIEAAHFNLGYGKMGGKSHDLFCLPLCTIPCHRCYEHNDRQRLIEIYYYHHDNEGLSWREVIQKEIDQHILRFVRILR